MKNLSSILTFIILLAIQPYTVVAQTVHLEKGKIEYKGSVKLDGGQVDLYNRAKEALQSLVKTSDSEGLQEEHDSSELKVKGYIKLISPYSIIKTVHYTIKLSTEDGKYKYRIEDVFIREKIRGGKTTDTPSEDLVKGMDTSGPTAINTEKQLNEIDMDFQQLLDRIRNKMEEAMARK